MDQDAFIIQGGSQISGTIEASGNKNAILPILAACALTDQKIQLENVPLIKDVDVMLDLLKHMGANISRDKNTVTIQLNKVVNSELPQKLCSLARTSFLFVAPLLFRTGKAILSPPGGDMIGRRRLDAHFYRLKSLGATIDVKDFNFLLDDKFEARELFFDEASVTATEHIMMAAVCAKGTTVLHNSASEPHVQDLAIFLNSMGAKIRGINTNTLTIEGVEKLGGTTHRVVSDHIEVGSYLALAAATGGSITINGVNKNHYWMINRVFNRFNIELDYTDGAVSLKAGQIVKIKSDAGGAIPRIDDGPWPQFPSDLMSVMIVLATQAQGTVLFFEKMFESRMYFVDGLIQMGANIIVCDPHRIVVSGGAKLYGIPLKSPDIRAGMALLMAAICAKGESKLNNAHIVDRGYQYIIEKLTSLGVDIKRI